MKKIRSLKRFMFFVLIAVGIFILAGCNASENIAEEEIDNREYIKVKDIHGEVEVPLEPKNIVSLDNRTFDTLASWDIKLAAAPKDVMPADSPYVKDGEVENIGNHREPNLEIIAAVNPDLVIVGQRFNSYYEDIKELVPNAAVLDLNFDVSKDAENPGENLVKGLNEGVLTLGKIFNKEEEANALVEEFNESIEGLKTIYNGEDKIMSLVVSGGDIGFSAPKTGRVWGPMYEIFNWKPALQVKEASSDHQGDDISVEAIAQSNPDWIFVLDRDAGVSSSEDSLPARDVIDKSPALKNTKAVKEGNIVYAPNDTYTNESIQTYIKLFSSIKKALSK